MDRPALQVAVADCLSEGFVSTILGGIDPTATISPEAAGLLEKVAGDFVSTLRQEAIKVARMRCSTSLKKKDICFALQSVYGIALPGTQADPFPAVPAQEYADQAAAVQSFLSGESHATG
jgi:hypothetical protein